MRDKNLMIGIIGCFAIAIAFVGVIIWEIKKSIDYDERVQQISKKANNVEVADNRDFSIYETLVGDDAREMILVPEGIFSRGSDSGGFD
jgi:exonuclease I